VALRRTGRVVALGVSMIAALVVYGTAGPVSAVDELKIKRLVVPEKFDVHLGDLCPGTSEKEDERNGRDLEFYIRQKTTDTADSFAGGAKVDLKLDDIINPDSSRVIVKFFDKRSGYLPGDWNEPRVVKKRSALIAEGDVSVTTGTELGDGVATVVYRAEGPKQGGGHLVVRKDFDVFWNVVPANSPRCTERR
jgi:hypothetical protein